LIDNFVRHGFKRLVFVNGHGGNDVPGHQAIFEARQRYRGRNDLLLLFATYWRLGGKPRDAGPSVRQAGEGDACAGGTSMLLRLRPDLVGDLSHVQAVSPDHLFKPAMRGWITKERSTAGHIGDPRRATAEKGEALFRTFADDVVRLLEKMIAWDGRSW